MILTHRDDLPIIPYTVKYKSLSGQKSTRRELSVVDFSSLRVRPGISFDELQNITPEDVARMRSMIIRGSGKGG